MSWNHGCGKLWGSWWTPMGFMMNPKVIFWGSKRSVLDDSRISAPKVHILMHIKTCFVSMRKWAQKLSKSQDLRHARVPMRSCQRFWILRETVNFRSGKSAMMNSFESRMSQILGFMMNPNGVHWGSSWTPNSFSGVPKVPIWMIPDFSGASHEV